MFRISFLTGFSSFIADDPFIYFLNCKDCNPTLSLSLSLSLSLRERVMPLNFFLYVRVKKYHNKYYDFRLKSS